MAFEDVRFAMRSFLGKNRSLALVCLLTLALGIGANTALFSVLKAVVLEPLPYPDSDRLVQLLVDWPQFDAFGIAYHPGPDYLDYRDNLESFESLACLYTYSPEGFNLSQDGSSLHITRLKVSQGYFETLGVLPRIGRTFSRQENLLAGAIDPERSSDYSPARQLAILSHGLWMRHFEGDPLALGRDIQLSGLPYAVIGVLPPGFQDPLLGEVDVFVPHNLSPGGYNSRGNHYLSIIGRLKPGVSLQAAQQEMNALTTALKEQHPQHQDRVTNLSPLKEMLVGDLGGTLWVLTAAVATLLLAACFNVANLLLAWGASRRKELAVRSALGSSRRRIVRQLLTESLILSILGGLTGLAVAFFGVRALIALRPESLPAVAQVRFDGWIFLFCMGAALVTGLLFGLAPAFRASRSDLESALREGGRDNADGSGRRLRQVLVGAQLALAVVLLVGAGLLAKSFMGILRQDLGFESSNLLTYRVNLPQSRYEDPSRRVEFYQNLHQRLESLPGVRFAGSISRLPVSGPYHSWGFRIPERPQDDDSSRGNAQIRVVDGRFFEALGIRLQRGRLFDSTDRDDAPPVILVNRALAKTYFPGEEILGKQLLAGGGTPRTVVGIIEDVRHLHLQPASAKVYLPHTQFGSNRNWGLYQVVASDGPVSGLPGLIRRQVARLDPQLAVYDLRSMEEVAAAGISQQRFATILMGLFSASALLLAAVGLFGVLSHAVSSRRREIGIRMALGANNRRVRHLVVRQGMTVALSGLLVGTAAAFGLSRFLASMVHQVSVTDPAVFLLMAGFLCLVSWAVAYLPARRATRVDPIRVLREE